MILVRSISDWMSPFGSIGSLMTTGTAWQCPGIATAPVEHCKFRAAVGQGRRDEVKS